MSDLPDTTRRAILQTAAGLAAGSLAPTSVAGVPAGKPGQFDFLSGNWKINHRRLKDGAWDTFGGEASCWSILAGTASIEELRIPERGFSGMGLRLLDAKQGVWCDYWVNGKDRVLATPGMTGGFADGVGTFVADDTDDGKPIRVRGVWDRISAGTCRWHQAVSRDGGRTWAENWFMDWTRA